MFINLVGVQVQWQEMLNSGQQALKKERDFMKDNFQLTISRDGAGKTG